MSLLNNKRNIFLQEPRVEDPQEAHGSSHLSAMRRAVQEQGDAEGSHEESSQREI